MPVLFNPASRKAKSTTQRSSVRIDYLEKFICILRARKVPIDNAMLRSVFHLRMFHEGETERVVCPDIFRVCRTKHVGYSDFFAMSLSCRKPLWQIFKCGECRGPGVNIFPRVAGIEGPRIRSTQRRPFFHSMMNVGLGAKGGASGDVQTFPFWHLGVVSHPFMLARTPEDRV